MRRFLVLFVWLLLVPPSCRNLPAIDKGVCGNAVVEPAAGEDCDRFAAYPGSACRPPGQSQACRYDCSLRADGSRPTCPDGMACANDGVCRWPSGFFEEKPVEAAAAAHELQAIDLDGDGRKDLIATERDDVAVRYFGDQAAPQAELSIPIAVGPSPAPGELSGDALPDLVVPFGGIVVTLGSADRSLVSTAYPSIAAPPETDQAYLIEAHIFDTSGESPLLLARNKGALIGGLVYVDAQGVVLLAPIGFAPDQLAGHVAVGNLNEDPASSPCDELVMPFKNAQQLLEFSPCKLDAKGQVVLNAGALTNSILLPPGDSVLGPVALLDLDGDGHLDVVTATSNAGQQRLDVGYGLGNGQFNSTSPVPTQADNHLEHVSSIAKPQPQPLAIGDLDGDGDPDYVDSQGAYIHRAAGFEAVADSDAETWSEAIIADLNHNGLPDVVAAKAGHQGAVFLNGAGGGHMNRFDVPSEGPLSHLSVGDFDGDLLGDVAASEDIGSTNGELLAIMFGRGYGAPEAAQRQGLLDHVLQVVKVRTYEYSPYAADSISVVSNSVDGTFVFGGFGGRGDRQLRSPFSLVKTNDKGAGVTHLPLRLATGRFNADDHGDLAELTERAPLTSNEFRLWLCPMTGLAAVRLSDPRSSDPLPAEATWVESEMAAGDLDGDGRDETVLFAPKKGGSGSLGYVARSFDTGAGRYAFKLGQGSAFTWRFSHTEGQDVPAGDAAGGRALVVDLDADKHADVVALAPTAGKTKGALVVFHGEGKPQLGKPDVVPATPDGPATAFAPIQTDRDPAVELALLAGSSVYIADLGSDGHYHVRAKPVAQLAGAAVITAGDFDGDGIEDLALANASTVAVFWGVPGIR